jgi:hypothetical protein
MAVSLSTCCAWTNGDKHIAATENIIDLFIDFHTRLLPASLLHAGKMKIGRSGTDETDGQQ